MSRQRKKLQLSKKKDYISELPDEIRSQLVSLLPLKEAVRTSVLSKSWISIWTSHTHIACESTNILGGKSPDTYGRFPRRNYIKRVDQIMQQRRSCGTHMNSILIRYPLTRKHKNHITSWISDAVMMGVETINLDLTGWDYESRSDNYTFPFSVLAAPECTVKHLQLRSCSFHPLSVSSSLASIVSVQLEHVDCTNEQLNIMLCNCLFLERMVLIRCCKILGKLKIESRRSSRLKYLAFKDCSKLKRIKLYAQNLEIVEYSGKKVYFSFKHVPKLAQLYLSFYGDFLGAQKSVKYALCQIANSASLPELQTLNIPLYPVKKFPNAISAMSNIKYLVLLVCTSYPDSKLCWISNILKAFPVMNKLVLSDTIPSSTRKCSTEVAKVIHENLRELEMNGYRGNRRQLELVRYLGENAVNLDLLVISPLRKVYKGSNNCYREKSRCTSATNFSSKTIKQLRSILPKAHIHTVFF